MATLTSRTDRNPGHLCQGSVAIRRSAAAASVATAEKPRRWIALPGWHDRCLGTARTDRSLAGSGGPPTMTTQRSFLYAALIVAAALLFGGCTLYFGPGDDDRPPPCDDPRYCGGTPGYQCDSDYECAAGCYCTDAEPGDGQWGTCVEGGYCGSAADCVTRVRCAC